MKNVQLTSDEILNKKFSTAPRGYDPLEVDQFLDSIIQDYINVEKNLVDSKVVTELQMLVKDLQKENKTLSLENAKLNSRLANIKDTDIVNEQNINLVKRINVLEKFLYRNGFHPDTIK